MAQGVFRTKEISPVDQFMVIDDAKIRMTLAASADRMAEKTRELIARSYNDTSLLLVYKRIRDSGIYEKGGKYRRKIVEYPSPQVYDFIDTVMTNLYGPGWQLEAKSYHHDLIKPWLVVRHI